MVKVIVEFGEIISKEVIEAREERIFNGVTYPATEERYRILTLSGADKTADSGYLSPTIVSHYVDKDTFGLFKPFDKVKVRYGYNGDDKAKTSQGIEKI